MTMATRQSLLVAWSDNSGYGLDGIYSCIRKAFIISISIQRNQFANIKTQSEKWKWKQLLQHHRQHQQQLA